MRAGVTVMPLAIDLFCGAVGGWSHGLHHAGIVTVAACEIDPWRRSVFHRQFPQAKMYDDVRTLTADRIRSDLGCLPDIVVGSPPCQEISAANSKGEGITDDHLFWEWARLVFEIRPLWCAAENSPHARTSGVDGILDALAQAGYAAWPLVVGAQHAGANHRRGRLWLVAADADRIGGDARGEVRGSAGEGRAHLGGHARHPAIVEGLRLDGVLGRGGAEPARADLSDDTDAEHCGRQGWRPHQDGRSAETTLPPALASIGLAWPNWNGGLPGLTAACAAAGACGVDDGLPAGLRNKWIAAYGDSVVPQITEALGRAMRTVYEN